MKYFGCFTLIIFNTVSQRDLFTGYFVTIRSPTTWPECFDDFFPSVVDFPIVFYTLSQGAAHPSQRHSITPMLPAHLNL